MTITHDLTALIKTGFEDGVAAAKEETKVGATFRGCAGSLRHRTGEGYGKDEYSVAFRGGYMHHIENLKIWTKDGVVKKVIAED